jgi:outer membrane lipoprotein SlyB
VAGVAGGAYAGNKIEGRMKTTKTWVVSVRFDNGGERSFNFQNDPGLIAGDAVLASGGGIVRR